MAAKTSTGAITRRLETPRARMAVISPSLAMRPSPIRIPTKHSEWNRQRQHRGHRQGEQRDYGFEGRVGAHQHFKTACRRPCRKMTHVASTVPSTALERISRNT